MRRRIIRQGNNTLTITLPRRWTRRMSVRPGDDVEVEERGNRLLVSTERSSHPAKTSVDITDFDTFAVRVLASLYREGYDEVDVRFSKPGMVKKIQDIISVRMIGFEIVNQGKNFCTIKNISTPLSKEFDTLVRRTFLLLVAMGKDTLEAIREKNLEALKDVRESEMVNNKYTSLCRRILNINGHLDSSKTPAMYSVLEEMEKIADEYKYLCTYIIDREGVTVSRELLAIFASVNALVEMFFTLFYSFTLEKAQEFWESRKELVKKLLPILEKRGGEETVIAHHLLSITGLTFDMLDPYLVTAL